MKCCDITPGMLREPVSFERMTTTTSDTGSATKTWAAISGAPTRAHVKATSGSERVQSARLDAVTAYRVTVRYSDLREGDRMVMRGRYHNIRFINNVEMRDRWLVLDVSGGVAV